MTEFEKLAESLFPHITKTPADYEAQYPPRGLKEGARVTRFAPSPTGYLHLGGLFGATVDRFTAHATDGLFLLRIEDTDKKREVENGIDAILNGLRAFDVLPDEGVMGQEEEKGDYGPYVQSKRAEIYQCFAKELVREGKAYPCFCSPEELDEIRSRQEAEGVNKGYYQKWAKCRDLSPAEAAAKAAAGTPYVLRYRSEGQDDRKCRFDDMIRGKIEMQENTQDVVLLKTDGIPTYHFAHVVDDHLMRVTHVIRGDEWIASAPIHLQLFAACGFKPPKYAHTAAVMKEDDGGKRKLSKRKDPEAAVTYFSEEGYPAAAVQEYLLTLINSNFEEWRRANPKALLSDFPFNLKKMSASGALFDMQKLNDVSKNVISTLNAPTVTAAITAWAEKNDPDFYALLSRDLTYAENIFAIDRDNPKPRKDIAKWSDAKTYAAYMFDELFEGVGTLPETISPAEAAAIVNAYQDVYDPSEEKQAWFETIKGICPALGYCPETKEYRKDPTGYKGHAGDLSTVIRLAITGRQNTPDLCRIMQLLGKERVLARLAQAEKEWRNK